MSENYSSFSYTELRDLLLSGELVHGFMTEEDYSDIIENELEQPKPNMEVLELCVQGLNRFDEYEVLKNIKIDMNIIFDETANKNKKNVSRRIIKVALIAAAVMVIALITQLVSLAFGFDIFRYIFNWSDEKVYVEANTNDETNDFIAIPEVCVYENKESIPDELLSFIPIFIQKNYRFVEATYLNAGAEFNLFLTYSSHFDINLTLYINKTTNYSIEKDNDYFEEIIKDGITYTVYNNVEYRKVLWIEDGLLYDMSVNLPLEEVKEIIDNF